MENSKTQKKDIPGLFALKALCALFVVIIHVPFIGKDTLAPIIRIAVPCFFMISGFFLYSGNAQTETTKAWKWVKKAFMLAFFINLFYFLFSSILGNFNIISFIKSFITGDSVAGHLWYLTALWQGLILFILTRKYLNPYIIHLIPLLAFINLLIGRYFFIFDNGEYSLPQYARLNCIAVALPYIYVGYLLRKYNQIFCGTFKWAILSLLFIICIYMEEHILNALSLNNMVSYSFFTLPVAICIFLFFLKGIKSVPFYIVQIGKKHSANIYYFHIFISAIIGVLIKKIGFNDALSPVKALIVYVACIVFSQIIIIIMNKIHLTQRA